MDIFDLQQEEESYESDQQQVIFSDHFVYLRLNHAWTSSAVCFQSYFVLFVCYISFEHLRFRT